MTRSVAEPKTAKTEKLSRRDLVLLPLIGVLTIFVLLVSSEVAVRVSDKIKYSAPFWTNYSLESLFTYDELGKRGKPNARYQKWILNNEGYRGPELRANTYRIVCLGSSETFGLYESDEGEWPRVLERELNEQGDGDQYEVVNAAYPGMSLPSILKRTPHMEETLEPRLAVVYPSFTSYIDEPEEPTTSTTQAPSPDNTVQWWPIELRITGMLENALKSHLPERAQTWMRENEIERAEKNVQVMSALPQSVIDQFENDLNQLVLTLQQNHTKVILVTHATRFSSPLTAEDQTYLVMWRRFYPQLSEDGLLDMESRMNQAIREVGERENVPVVDAARQIPPGGQNFQEFSHFTDHGAYTLATLVEQQILKQAK